MRHHRRGPNVPDGRVQIRIGGRHDRGRSTTCGEPCDIDAGPIHGVVVHDLTGNARDQSGLSAIPLLITGTKPIPALLGVGRRRLGRIGDQEDLLLRQRVHSCAGRKIVRRLGASVQHDDERDRLTGPKAARDIKLVGAAPMRAGMNGHLESRAVRYWRAGTPHGVEEVPCRPAQVHLIEKAAKLLGCLLAGGRGPAAIVSAPVECAVSVLLGTRRVIHVEHPRSVPRGGRTCASRC